MSNQPELNAQLFTVRLWPEKTGGLSVEWRGEVKHVTSGRTRYFREWSNLVTFLTQEITTPPDQTGSTGLK